MSWLQIIIIIYCAGMLITWLLWRDRMLGGWVQGLFTWGTWPVLVIMLTFVYFNHWRNK